MVKTRNCRRPFPETRFWNNTIKKSNKECWNWIAANDSMGYGHFMVNGKTVKAHRYSYEYHNNKIPFGLCVLHKCDNRKCVNPNHLFLGTQLDNIKDRDNKNRQAKGEHLPISKLTKEQVIQIRKLYKSTKTSTRKLGYEFNVSCSTIKAILTNRTWKHIK